MKITDYPINSIPKVDDFLLHELFEEQTRKNPHNSAVIFGNRSITYRELDNRANRFSLYLQGSGVIPGDIVGIFLRRSIDIVITLLGILKLGCAYIPLDPSFPADRIKYMINDCGVKVVITQKVFKEMLDYIHDSILIIDEDTEEIKQHPAQKPTVDINNESLAYIIYTSGSTGNPKGVKIHHQAAVNFLLSMKREPGFRSTDRLLAVTTLSFDISVLELFLPLSCGGELVISPDEGIFNGHEIAEILEKHDITVMQGAPATWNVLIESGWKGKENLKALCGGEALSPNLADQLLSRVGELWNMYGPTETTVWSTCYKVVSRNSRIMVGKPIDNTRVLILDSNKNNVPVMATGEVYIGGMGVSKGYHNQPDKTAERFIKLENNNIFYRTGDIGRYFPDGNLELLGRIDNQVKVDGIRIEPGEIESVLSDIKGVLESVVKIHEFNEKDRRLVAFLHINNEYRLSDEELNDLLSRKLPKNMIPDLYQKFTVFPRMPNGKINRIALNYNHSEAISAGGECLSETEEQMIKIWGSVLKKTNIRKSDNFFGIGGTSLLAIWLINRLNKEFGLNLSIKILLDYPVLADISSFINSLINTEVRK
jgi:amino acid adenylation domain-containing protein